MQWGVDSCQSWVYNGWLLLLRCVLQFQEVISINVYTISPWVRTCGIRCACIYVCTYVVITHALCASVKPHLIEVGGHIHQWTERETKLFAWATEQYCLHWVYWIFTYWHGHFPIDMVIVGVLILWPCLLTQAWYLHILLFSWIERKCNYAKQ